MKNWLGSGPWTREQVETHLSLCRVPLRLGCLDGTGRPRVVSLWFEWNDSALYCATQKDSAVARWLGASPAVGFEVSADSPPYRGVRGSGIAEIDLLRGSAQLRRLLDRYAVPEDAKLRADLLRRTSSEVAIRIDPIRIDSWDYTERMTGVR